MSYKNHDRQKEYQREWRANRRLIERKISFDKLGSKCAKCSNKDFRVLQIDHIVAIRRKIIERNVETGTRMRQRIANGSRDVKNLQLLCANCHQIKTYEELWGVSSNSKTRLLQS